MSPPVDRWREGEVEHTRQTWTLAEALSDFAELFRRHSTSPERPTVHRPTLKVVETTTTTTTRSIEVAGEWWT